MSRWTAYHPLNTSLGDLTWDVAIQVLVHLDIDHDAKVWASLREVNTMLQSLHEALQSCTRISDNYILKFANEENWLDEEYFQRVFDFTGLHFYYLQGQCSESGLIRTWETVVCSSKGEEFVLNEGQFKEFEYKLTYYRRKRLRGSILRVARSDN